MIITKHKMFLRKFLTITSALIIIAGSASNTLGSALDITKTFVNAGSTLQLLHNALVADHTTSHGNLVNGGNEEGVLLVTSSTAAGNKRQQLIVGSIAQTMVNTKVFAKKVTSSTACAPAYDVGKVAFVGDLDIGNDEAIEVNQNVTVQGNVNNTIGIAAGDKELSAKYGLWVMPVYGESIQKALSTTAGYKVKTGGATIGFYALLNKRFSFGIATTINDSKLRYRNQRSGDTTTINTATFSLYASQNFGHNFFAQEIIYFSTSNTRNNAKRAFDLVASSKFKSTSYAGQVMVGYRCILNENAAIAPLVGIIAGSSKNDGYTETGAGVMNLTVKKNSINSFASMYGLRASMKHAVDNTILEPEAHAVFTSWIKNKAPSIDVRLVGMSATLPSFMIKTVKQSYNLGTSLTIKYRMMEYGFGYDAYLAKKYIGHQGSLKVRVNF